MNLLKASVLLSLALTTPNISLADELSDADIKALVYEAILENPQIIMEAVALLEQQQIDEQQSAAAAVLSDRRDVLEQDPNAPVLANPDGDVTIVEFFDYNCPYCRQAMPQVDTVVARDQGVRLVYREWPILGEGSVFAAKAALAARVQGKYEELHVAMMGMQGRANEGSVLSAARDIGLDIDKLRADMEAPEVNDHIQTSMELARALGFSGTPSFVIGDELVPGFVEADVLLEQVSAMREARK